MDVETRTTAGQALAKLDPNLLQRLRAELESIDPSRRLKALQILDTLEKGVELLKPVGGASSDYLWTPELSRSTQAAGWTRDLQSWRVGSATAQPFLLRAVFRRETVVGANTPILDSPVLDDLTVLYDAPGGPRVLSWEEGE